MTKHTINAIIDRTMVTRPPEQSSRRRDTALALGVGLFLFAVYLLSYRGGFHSVDEVSMFAVTESLVKFGRLNTDQITWTQWTTSQREAQGFFGVDGHVYSKKGLALSLAMAPLYWLGLVIPGLGMLQTASLLNAILTAATAGLLFLVVRRLGYHQRVAIATTLLYGLATIAWVYSKYLFSEPLAGLLLLTAAFLLILFRQQGGSWRVGLAGLCAGLAVTARANNLFLIPVFGAYLLTACLKETPAKSLSASTLRSSLRILLSPTSYSLLPILFFLLGLIPPALLLMGYNWVRAGNPLQTGYDLTIFSPNLLIGLYKLLFSPLRGLFVYSPLLILSLPGLVWLWQRRRAEAALAAGVSGVTILLFSAWTSGEGLSWGSRFLVPIVPFLCLPLAPILERAWDGSRLLTGLLVGIGLLSFAIQFLGVTINPWIYLAQLQTDFGGEFFLENTPALADFRYAQILGQFRSWSLENSDVVWWQPWGFDGLSLAAMVLLLALSGAWLWAAFRRPDSLPWPVRSPYPGIVLAVIISLFVLGRAYRSDLQFGPTDNSYSQALATAAVQAEAGDSLLSVAPYHYHVPMNRFKARVPIIGFAQQQPPLPDTALPLLEESISGDNAWMVTVGFTPARPDNATEGWLAVNAFKATDEWFGDARLVHYGTNRPTTTRNVNTTLNGELELTTVSLTDLAQAGQVLSAEFTWQVLHQPGADYNLFLQLLAPDGRLVAQHDGPPIAGYALTSDWLPGDVISDRHGLALPADLPSGQYRLIAGLVHPGSGERLVTSTGGDFVDLGTVTIP